MNIHLYHRDAMRRPKSEILLLPLFQSEEIEEQTSHTILATEPSLKFTNSIPDQALSDHSGKPGEISLVYASSKDFIEGRVLLLGLGKASEVTLSGIREAYAAAVKFLQSKRFSNINLLLPHFPQVEKALVANYAAAIIESLFLSNYRFDDLRHDSLTKPNFPRSIQSITMIDSESILHSDLITYYATLSNGVNLARDLINGNAKDVTPEYLAGVALDLGAKNKRLKVTVEGNEWLAQQKMDLILAVNAGASAEARFIVLEYMGAPKKEGAEVSVVIGKGITYDTGGLNLKPTGSMETMKCDMSGAATVLGLMQVLAQRNIPVNVIGIIASTENAIDSHSYKPGDVYSSYLGKTVEIGNTDAEGRLILADTLAYANKTYKPARMINLATLTGAIVIALGEEATGLFSNNDDLATTLTNAGNQVHERLWRLPLFAEYSELLRSDIADIKSTGGRAAGSILAALFLQEFVGKTPWAHLDIAGTAYLSKAKGMHSTPATGVGVRLLTKFFETLASS